MGRSPDHSTVVGIHASRQGPRLKQAVVGLAALVVMVNVVFVVGAVVRKLLGVATATFVVGRSVEGRGSADRTSTLIGGVQEGGGEVGGRWRQLVWSRSQLLPTRCKIGFEI